MDLSVFFEPQREEIERMAETLTGSQLGSRTLLAGNRFPDWKQAKVVLIGVPSLDRPLGMPDAVRQKLYQLSLPHPDLAIADLGNLKPKETMEAYWDALAYIMELLLKEGKTLVLLADDPATVLGQYKAYEGVKKEVEYVHVDSQFRLRGNETASPSHDYNRQIFVHEPNYLYNYTNLGYQRYLVTEEEISSINELHFDAMRYGELDGQIADGEPYFRDADLVALDLSSIRYSDFSAGLAPSPGGFSVNEICRIGRYAGMGTSLSSLCLTGMDPQKDDSGMSSQSAALILWYFFEGIYNRKPVKDKTSLRKYSAQLHATIDEIIFYENPATRQWWMEVPFQDSLGKPNPKTRMVACRKEDYEIARRDEIPDRWWQVYNKLK